MLIDLLFYGVNITDELLQQLKREGGMELPEGGKAEFLTKTINDQFTENVLNRLKTDIYRFAKAVDMSDEKFSGDAQTGESRKWKMKSLVDDAVIKEATYEESSLKMFEVLTTHLTLFDSTFSTANLNLIFTPNLPMDLKYYAEVGKALQGQVSERTRLSLMPFITNVDEEMQRLEDEGTQDTIFNEELIANGIRRASQQPNN